MGIMREREKPIQRRLRNAKQERLQARLSAVQKERLQRAADLEGRTLSDFVVDSAQRHAEEVIREHEIMTLSERDSRALVEALLIPPAPSEHLRAAFARYRQEVVER